MLSDVTVLLCVVIL